MKIRHDPKADAVYIQLSDKNVVKTKTVRGNMSDAAVDYDIDGDVVGIELLGVRTGIDIKGLPNAEEVSKALLKKGFFLIASSDSDRERAKDSLRK